MKNELIRELEKQSFITTETQKISGAWDNIVEPFRYVTVTETNFSLEKFAELIVKECARVAFESDLTMAIGQWGADSAILKHFGVEE
jgi:hypothetical protein